MVSSSCHVAESFLSILLGQSATWRTEDVTMITYERQVADGHLAAAVSTTGYGRTAHGRPLASALCRACSKRLGPRHGVGEGAALAMS